MNREQGDRRLLSRERADPPRPAPNTPVTNTAQNVMLYCPNCSQRLESRSCKLRCDRCGYFMDCSDYY
ncbi:MAG: hypothetical protein F4X77_16120 [Acidobacteriia bacterium]|nr:hypothetical protein [Terriglobia bacterium]MYC67001.1 hypothetical protein [Terriglobia bacterium]